MLSDLQRRIGTTIGKYRLDELIAVGGTAAVFAATENDDKRVAVKLLLPDPNLREKDVVRFLREGYVANRVNHPGAVTVFDDDCTDDGSAFLVMELLDGMSAEEIGSATSAICRRRLSLRSPTSSSTSSPRRTRKGSSTATSSRPTSSSPTKAS